MTADEKAKLIRALTIDLQRVMLERLPRAPKDWDGIEFRQWMCDLAVELYQHPMKGARYKEYLNTRNINPNL